MKRTPRNVALDALARREHSVRELMERLHKAFPEQDADAFVPVIERLQEDGLQSDERFAEAYVRMRVGKGHGSVKIAHELLQRGISEGLAARSMADCNWFELGAAALQKKFGHGEPVDIDEKARMARFLQQRGFSYGLIDELLS
ncbi:MAG: regulatory protein RecX [Natronospirillum sp.]